MRDERLVVQVGPVRGMPGGISSVITEYEQLDLAPFRQRRYVTYRPGKPLLGVLSALAFPFWALPCILRGDRPVVHVHLSEGGSFAREGFVALVASALRLRVVATLHGARFLDFAAAQPRLVRRVLRACNVVLCLGAEHAAAVNDVSVNADVRLVMNPVDVPERRRRVHPRGRLVVFGGEVGTRKGIDRLLRAWPAVLADLPDARLAICGPMGSDVVEMPPDVEYHGAVTRDDLRALLAQAAVACLPSRQEVLPVFILEALVEGTPVVATKAGEWQSFAGAETVHWVENEDGIAADTALASALIGVLTTDPDDAAADRTWTWLEENASRGAVAATLVQAYSTAPFVRG